MPISKRRRINHEKHRRVIRAVLAKFLPTWVDSCRLLHVRGRGSLPVPNPNDTLRLHASTRRELPDIVAYSEKKNWLFLIEAVHSSGPISQVRLLELKRLTSGCTADIVYVTAFLNRDKFRTFAPDIAWETEVWIADAPDHLVHFDGDKFLGPYKAP